MLFRSPHRLFILLAGSAPAALLCAPAHAQDHAAATTEAAAQPADATNDIIVTAQRRAERLEAVPISITAVTASTLEKTGITRFQDLGNIAPSVQISRQASFVQPSIRGVTTLTTGQGYENNVAIYVDGIYQPDTISINGDLVNVSDIQVLKGPQGTLYGRNATAGAILISTAKPSDTWTGSTELTYARFNDKRAKVYLSGPLADGLAFSLAGYVRRSDGYMRDIGNFNSAPLEENNIRAKLQYEASDKLKFTLGYVYTNILDSRGATYRYYDNVPASLKLPGLPASTTRYGTSINFPADNRAIAQEFSLIGEWETGIGTLTSHTSYFDKSQHTKYDFDGTPLNASVTDLPGKQHNFQQSLDYTINRFDWVDLVVGASYYNDTTRARQTGAANGVYSVTQYFGQKSQALAVYADATFKPTSNLFVTVGGRYSHEHKNGFYSFGPGNIPSATPFAPASDKSANFSAFTPRGVIRYELAPRTNVYASVTRGFRTGTFPVVPFSDPSLFQPIKPETITAYELGFKTANRVLQFNLAGYYYDFKNLQVGLTVPNPLAPTTAVQQVLNAKKAEIYGVEGDVAYNLSHDFVIRAGAAWTHARYTDFATATGTGLNAATGLNVTAQPQDWSGQQMARAPNFSGNIGFTWQIDTEIGKIDLSGNTSYTSSYVQGNPSLYGPLAGALATMQRYRQGAYALMNAQVGWTDVTDHVTVKIFGQNLTNTRYLITSSGGSFGSYRTYGEPMTYGISVGYKF